MVLFARMQGERCDIVRSYNPNEPIEYEPMSRYHLRVHPCELVPSNMCSGRGQYRYNINTYSYSCNLHNST